MTRSRDSASPQDIDADIQVKIPSSQDLAKRNVEQSCNGLPFMFSQRQAASAKGSSIFPECFQLQFRGWIGLNALPFACFKHELEKGAYILFIAFTNRNPVAIGFSQLLSPRFQQ